MLIVSQTHNKKDCPIFIKKMDNLLYTVLILVCEFLHQIFQSNLVFSNNLLRSPLYIPRTTKIA